VSNALEADPTMDPKKAECLGLYLYGSGYYASQDQQAAILLGRRSDANFCMECPLLTRCVEKHRERTRDLLPEAWEGFVEQVREARRRGVGEHLVEAVLQRAGHPSPLMVIAMQNYKRGVEHRRRVAGAALRRRQRTDRVP
jgi:GNAT superfamily N-acetyltransferase